MRVDVIVEYRDASVDVIVEYRDAKRDPDNYVCICVDIPKLKKKLFGGGAANADIMLELAERYMCLFNTRKY